ncbi:MAG: HesA/MoeB/ThiF family protein, partial [Bacteroidaceae bacterium]|nr:HesA/MoeB/ThiF family protein [Bacteroidaceae bacterium]
MTDSFSSEQKRRYNRHLILDGIGAEGQRKLLDARVLIVGAGGLGSPVALYLAAAGVGTIGLADGDTVSLTNLQRQIIHRTEDVGVPKVDSAERSIKALNPDVVVEKYDEYLTEDTILDVVKQYDFIIDGTDNFAVKYLINDACVMAGKPFCMGGINRYSGQLMTHVPGSACYRCMFPEPPAVGDVETCSMVGVLGSIAGICGTIQATEAIKYITAHGELLTDTLLTFDAQNMQFTRFDF